MGLVCALPAAACGSEAPAPPPRVVQLETAPVAPEDTAVTVVIRDLPPGRRIESVTLIDPDGGRHPAEGLREGIRESGRAGSNPWLGINITGGSSEGIEPSVSIGYNLLGGGAAVATRSGRFVSARVPLAEPAAFRREARAWRIEVVLSEITGERRTITVPAAE